MILHIVLFDFKKNVSWRDNRVIEAEQASQRHPHYIPQIRKWTAARNVTSRNQSADFCVMGLFDSKDDLDVYQSHEDHLKGVAKWKEISEWKVMDIELMSDEIFNFDRVFSESQVQKENINAR